MSSFETHLAILIGVCADISATALSLALLRRLHRKVNGGRRHDPPN